MPLRSPPADSTLDQPAPVVASTVTFNLAANEVRIYSEASDWHYFVLARATESMNSLMQLSAAWLDSEKNRLLAFALDYVGAENATQLELAYAEDTLAQYQNALSQPLDSDTPACWEARWQLEVGCSAAEHSVEWWNRAYGVAVNEVEFTTEHLNERDAMASAHFDARINAQLQNALKAAAALNAIEHSWEEPAPGGLFALVPPYLNATDDAQTIFVIEEQAADEFTVACEPIGMPQCTNMHADSPSF